MGKVSDEYLWDYDMGAPAVKKPCMGTMRIGMIAPNITNSVSQSLHHVTCYTSCKSTRDVLARKTH